MGTQRSQWLAAVLFWTFIALLSGSQIWLLSQQPGEEFALGRALVWQSTFYLAWIPFTVLIWQVIARRELDRGGVRLVALHLGASLVVAVLQSVCVVIVATWSEGWLASGASPVEAFGQMVVGQVRGRIYLQIVIYAGIAAAGQAFVWHTRWRDRAEAAARLEAQLADARLSALREQLNPHFLFNSLHAVASLVRESRNPEAVRLIADMSELLRRVLDTDRVWHTLSEEFALVRTYLDVQRVRFEDRLVTSIDMDARLSDVSVPVLLLQPLVENALRHGLADKVGPGHVSVTARADDDHLVLTVRDDGVGMAPGEVSTTPTEGTGLANLRARLATLYADRASLELRVPDSGGCAVVIRVPVAPA